MAIGASAGGLEAIEQFLGGVPESSGLSFVVIQHLDPTHQGVMPELLQRVTRMRVEQVKDRTRAEANHVYVIPPNSDLSVLRGVLHLVEPTSPRGQRLPIDFFLRALADDRRSASVGVILSGMGTDGTLGLKAVKERGGVVLAQEPATAKFDGMPRSAIDTRLVDVVAPAKELPARLLALLHGTAHAVSVEPTPEPQAKNALDKIVLLLRSRLGHDFSQYKKSTLERRVARRMALHQITRSGVYLRYLQDNPQEQELLFREFLIGVTNFFRDPAAWDALRDEAIPALLAARPKGGQLRAWIPGCSTGEEAYSLGVIFKEALEKARPKVSFSLLVFATDLDRHAIEKARQGVYPANISSDVTPKRLRRFFVKEQDGTYRVNKELRETVILAQQDVTRDPPFTRMDLVVCRNLLIYLEPDLQRRLIPLFHYSLRPGGILFLGTAETICGLTDLFGSVDAKLRLYRRKESPTRLDSASVPSFFSSPPAAAAPDSGPAKPSVNLQAMADELILRQFGPAAALVNETGDILYINGRTGKYLEPAAGKANWNVLAMAREGLRHAVASALQRASRQERAITVRGLTVGMNGGSQGVDLTVKPLQDPDALRGTCLVVFRDVAAAPATGDGGRRGRRAQRLAPLAVLEREVKQLHDELRNTREDMQTSQEELRSANEELQSTNEELQSTNEELTTSKEEMQSMNEELQTVNAELQAKLDELSRASNDMKNLLDSTEIATIFLDDSLCIRRYTEQATRFLRLIPTDVGRPITDVTTDLVFPELPHDVAKVLRTLVPMEQVVTTKDGRWFSARVMPYRTLDDFIEGVVITFVDVTAAKRLESELRSSRERFGALLENLPDGLAVVDGLGRVLPRSSVLTSITDARSQDLASWRIVATPADEPGRGAVP
ncbi:MAG: chemotaxis protein CheB [Anaeromyxobacter sp. RBG_16_69_14]|nr:MAG: chemotaxis protein CheB [Anaeromyxobacter sp. RBG_16_69_14]